MLDRRVSVQTGAVMRHADNGYAPVRPDPIDGLSLLHGRRSAHSIVLDCDRAILVLELILVLVFILYSFFVCAEFLQRVSIACYAERCISYSKSVRLSVRLSVTRWH